MKTVLFVCVENSNRSQMAEAFARMHGGDRVHAASAGSRPSGRINPKAVAAMQELGYDLTTHASKGLEAFNGAAGRLENPGSPRDVAGGVSGRARPDRNEGAGVAGGARYPCREVTHERGRVAGGSGCW